VWRSLKEVPGLIHLGEENKLGGDGEAVDREWRLAMVSVPGRISEGPWIGVSRDLLITS
jgi:hypothetical protein